ncbi:hypothetical protein V1282_005630 [Nitrobacteraceae bacterium AZCC 2146]
MTRRGSETRRKAHSVLVRLTEAEYLNLTKGAEREAATRAEYLRRRLNEPSATEPVLSTADGSCVFSEIDRIQLASLTRSMGHLAGLMKLAVLKGSAIGQSQTVQSVLEDGCLLELQGQIRALLERAS